MSLSAMEEESQNFVVFDTDVGTDDAWALLMLIRAEEKKLKNIKILGVTCVHGNTEIEHVVRNVFRVLDTVNRPDIPVFKGASGPLLPIPMHNNPFFHGVDGFGDIYEHGEDDKIFRRLQKEHAVTALYDFASKYPKKVTFILVGPLTNFALCMKMYPDFADKVKDVYIMGGNRKGVGNITSCAEYNFYCDPEAAYIVTNESRITKIILPWEPCLPKPEQKYTSLEWRLKELSAINNPITKLMDPVDSKCYGRVGRKQWCPCDACLMAVFLFPELIIKKESKYHVSVELIGTNTRGQMILDHKKEKADNARVIEMMHLENFKEIAEWTVGCNINL